MTRNPIRPEKIGICSLAAGEDGGVALERADPFALELLGLGSDEAGRTPALVLEVLRELLPGLLTGDPASPGTSHSCSWEGAAGLPEQPRWIRVEVIPRPGVRTDPVSRWDVVISDASESRVSRAAEASLERREIEMSLRKTNARLEQAVRIARLGIWDWEIATDRVEWNDEMLRIYGVRRAEFTGRGRDYIGFTRPDYREAQRQNIEAAFQSGVTEQELIRGREPRFAPRELCIVRPDGEERFTLGDAVSIVDEEGRPVRMLGVTFDITAFKRAQEVRNRLQAQLSQAQKLESIGRLAGGVAHDFNNMLGVILGSAEIALLSTAPSSPVHANLLEIRHAAERSADLTRRLLAFARKQTVTPRVLDLNETIARMLKMLQRLAGEKVQVEWTPGPKVWPVLIDPVQLDQILANLTVNARDAISGAGTVRIETRPVEVSRSDGTPAPGLPPGEYALLEVSDDGCGMDAETLVNIFEPFFTTKDAGRGAGLGLATVYGAVTQNGGFISVSSQPGRGTSFRIFLPRTDGPAASTSPE